MGRYLKIIIPAILGFIIIYLFARSLNWFEVWQSLKKADLWLLGLATLVICFGYYLRALRWKTLLAPITEASLRELFATTTIGFAALFLVGRAGEAIRPLWLPMRDHRVRPAAALVTIGLERILDLLALVLLFSLNLLWFQAPPGREAEFVVINRIGFLMLAAMVAGIISLIVFQRFSSVIIEKTKFLLEKTFIPARLTLMLVALLRYLAASLEVLRNPKQLALTIFWTAALWLAISVPTWLIMRAFGPSFTFSQALFVMGWASVASLVPTPGGAAGAFHATTAAALMWVNVERDDAAAMAIAMHLICFAPALFFGFYYFIRGDISLERFRTLIFGGRETTSEPTNDLQQQLKTQKLRIDKTEFGEASATKI